MRVSIERKKGRRKSAPERKDTLPRPSLSLSLSLARAFPLSLSLFSFFFYLLGCFANVCAAQYFETETRALFREENQQASTRRVSQDREKPSISLSGPGTLENRGEGQNYRVR